MKWMSGGTKRQCDRAGDAPAPAPGLGLEQPARSRGLGLVVLDVVRLVEHDAPPLHVVERVAQRILDVRVGVVVRLEPPQALAGA
jgi:hypothetical protein